MRIASVENGSRLRRPLLQRWTETYRMMPQECPEDPVEVFKRQVYVHPFHEEDIKGMVELLGADHVLFGSDFPHPEAWPIPSATSTTSRASPRSVVKIMGGNLAGLLKVEAPLPRSPTL